MEFIEYPKCSTCKKAKKHLEDNHFTFKDRNIIEATPTKEELKSWIKKYNIPIKKLFNTSGLKYRELGLKEKLDSMTEEKKITLLSSDGMLIKRPILITKNKIYIGYKEKEYNAIMKKKITTETYLREAIDYKMKVFIEKEYYICVKKLIHLTEKFVITDGIIGMDDGYYVVEIIPKSGHQALRIFLDDKKNVVEYYFDVIKESGIENGIPYFLDLYLDITLLPSGKVKVLDEEELEDAYKEKVITKEEYDLAKQTKDEILDEIKNKTNNLMSLDVEKYINML